MNRYDISMITIPTFRDISRLFNFESHEEECRFAYEYTLILSDLRYNKDMLTKLFDKINLIIREYKENYVELFSFDHFVNDILEILYTDNLFLECLYGRVYISILLAIIVIIDVWDHLKSCKDEYVLVSKEVINNE